MHLITYAFKCKIFLNLLKKELPNWSQICILNIVFLFAGKTDYIFILYKMRDTLENIRLKFVSLNSLEFVQEFL